MNNVCSVAVRDCVKAKAATTVSKTKTLLAQDVSTLSSAQLSSAQLSSAQLRLGYLCLSRFSK
jgi:hypothetical protein